ncbi:hypothetical protein OQJ62_16620 [Microbulbifer thermotolerans]|uniref:hypothetical protein n=1 Tax=Microbulbifer thermotolerans TaxID=252514 RepID=UPI002248831C|nr:hypothetical protein [Microbulbifer thermotolerans]MCX2796533.1 hypothetical protein [Microbulbifer thermotolerans]
MGAGHRITKKQSQTESKSALWNIEYNVDNEEWEKSSKPEPILRATEKLPGTKVKPIKVGINGYANNLYHAASMLPSHISRGEEPAINSLKNSGYNLFYVPQSGSSLKAGWSFLRDLGRTNRIELEAARILAAHMKEAHEQELYVEWTSHRGGSKVLTTAMKLLAQRSIKLQKKQQIFLSDHTSRSCFIT